MRKIEVGIYKFDELSKEAQDRVIESFRRSNWEDSTYSDMLTEWMEQFIHEEKGYGDMKVSWSLSCCQGDGVSFTGKIDNEAMRKLAQRLLNDDQKQLFDMIIEAGFTIETEITRNNSMYVHKYSVATQPVEDYSDDIDTIAETLGMDEELVSDLFDTLEAGIEEDRKELCDYLEEQGYKEIEFRNSEKEIRNDIEAGEYEFYEDGTQI